MDSNFDKSLIKVLEHEGGYVYHPEDPGGETNLGVTKKVYDNWIAENDLVVKDMQDITVNDVMPIYKKNYWLKAKCDQLPIGIDYIIFDMSVNHGVSRAAKFLQGVVGAEQDGVIGSKTLAMVDKMEQADIVEALCLEREDFYRNLKTFNTFGNGWLNRNSGVKTTSLEMIAT
jgi:lysozyme family protein